MCTICPEVIAGFLRAILEKLPTVDLTIVEMGMPPLLDAGMKGEMDVALFSMPNSPDRLNPIPLFSERYGGAFAKGHRFERMNAVRIKDLDA